MAQTVRCFRLAGLGLALVILLLGCRRAVTGQNAMPDNAALSPADQRKAMIQWHQQHDKNPAGYTPQSGR